MGVDGGDGGESCQLYLVGYEKSPQDQLVVGVSGLVGWVRGVFLVVCLYAEDGGGNVFRDGSVACAHEGSRKERRDRDAISVAMDGGIQEGVRPLTMEELVMDVNTNQQVTCLFDLANRKKSVTCVG